MTPQGWIKLHRKLTQKAFYRRPLYLALWVHILLSANHEEREFIWNGAVIIIKKGQFVTGRKQLSAQSGIPESTVEDILRFLEKEQQIRQQKTTKYRLITVLKWPEYQNSDNKPTTSRQQADTNKNDKKEKNISEPKVSDNKKPLEDNQDTMGNWNKQSDNDDDIVAIDLDTREEIETKESKAERENKELNEKIRHNLKLFEPLRGIAWGTGKDMNFHVKEYRELINSGWSHESILSAFIEIVGQPHWKEEKEKGNYPGINTVRFHLRNKKPV